MNIKWIGADPHNFGVGRLGNKIDKVVLHWIVGTLASADATFQSPTRIASAHYGIGDDQIHQYVKEEDTAYHAGNLLCNRQSIGIEHQGGPNLPISEATYLSSAQLVADICKRYSIPLDRDHIKKHKEVSDKITECPGTLDVDKIISLAKGINTPVETDMTDDQKRAIAVLEQFKKDNNHGNLEGAANAAVGAARDLPDKIAQIGTLTERVKQLEVVTTNLTTDLEKLKLDVSTNQQSAQEWQDKFNSANEQLGTLSEQVGILTDDKNKYRRLYETALDNTVDKKTGWQLVRLGIAKLTIKK